MSKLSRKEVALIVISILLLVIIGVIAYRSMSAPRNGDVRITEQTYPQDRLPDRIPLDLPSDSSAVVVQNSSMEAADGRIQETRAYNSSLSFDEQVVLYSAYFHSDDWQLKDEKSFPGYHAYLASRGTLQVQVTINRISSGGSSINVVSTIVAPTVTPIR